MILWILCILWISPFYDETHTALFERRYMKEGHDVL